MLSVVITSSITVFVLGGYRLLWRHRYGAKRIDGHFVRAQGRVTGTEGEVVLRRTAAGEVLRRRSVELELGDRVRQPIDLRSPWLILIGRTIRRGQTVTVDGLPTSQPRDEALYREAAVQPALEALRVAPGAWPELRLLRLAAGFAALLLVGALALPRFVTIRTWQAFVPPDPEPVAEVREISIDCPKGTRKLGGAFEAHCENAAGKSHGPSISYWSNLNLQETGQYVEGMPHGSWISFHWNGSLAVERTFDRGRRTGCWRSYHENGQLELRHCFRDGEGEGAFGRWNERGQLLERGAEHKGLKHGLWQVWSSEGILLREGRHQVDGREGLWRFWNADGGRSARGSYRDGKHDGLWSFWHDTGKLSGRGRYRLGVKEGRWVAFYPSGRLAAVATYREGKRTSLKVWREEEWLASRESND